MNTENKVKNDGNNSDNKKISSYHSGREHTHNYYILIRALLLFYLSLLTPYTENLLSKQLQDFIRKNRFAQHIISFIALLTIIIIIGNVPNVEKAIFYAIIFYAWFLFTTKLDVQWNIIILLLLLFGFIYESKVNEKDNDMYIDDALTIIEKKEILDSHGIQKMYILIGILLVTVVGASLYIKKQEIQHGGGFDIMKFIFD